MNAPITKRADALIVHSKLEDVRDLVREELETALLARSNAPDAPALLTQDQLAKALVCSVRTIFTLREQGCPVVMLLESPRFDLAAVIKWLETRDATIANLDRLLEERPVPEEILNAVDPRARWLAISRWVFGLAKDAGSLSLEAPKKA
jgi:hypothetical protein